MNGNPIDHQWSNEYKMYYHAAWHLMAASFKWGSIMFNDSL